MATHYDVLGIATTATPEEVRRAYHERARRLHPDRAGDERAMQAVNEAWRVLRDAGSRAAYDRDLLATLLRRPAPAGPPPVDPDIDLDDRPIPRAPAEPGDVGIAIVRALPWVAVLVVLAIIFVFTAFARTDRDGTGALIGECVTIDAGRPEAVPCDEPNVGQVSLEVDRQTQCPSTTSPLAVVGDRWLCVRPADSR